VYSIEVTIIPSKRREKKRDEGSFFFDWQTMDVDDFKQIKLSHISTIFNEKI